jgi:hypothetical protein
LSKIPFPLQAATHRRNFRHHIFSAPGTGIYASETEARNPPSAHPGDPETGALVKKARQWRANIANLQKVPDSQTAWWWMQSDANPSLPANWEMQGDFDEMQGEQ